MPQDSPRLRTGLAFLLIGAQACAMSHEVPAIDTAPSDAAQVAGKVWSPLTVEQARTLRDSFSWEDTQELPETTLTERTPPEQRQAVQKGLLDGAAWVIASMASLYYVQIYIKSPDHLRELDELGVQWDMAPLFESELPDADNVVMTFEGDPADHGGTFVYAFMPAIIYNGIRAAALLGDETYDAMILRTVPAEARAWDGSVKWEYLAGTLLAYAQPHTHLTDDGETAFPSVIDAEAEAGLQAAPQAGDAPAQKRFGRRLRKFVRKVRDVARSVVDGVRKGVGELAKLVRPQTELVVLVRVASNDPNFASLQRAWDRYGSEPTFGKDLRLANTRVNVSQLGGISLFPTKTDSAGKATVSVPRDRRTHVCVEADSPAARMEAGLLWPVRSCAARFMSRGTVQGTAIMLTRDEFSALAQLQDAREFASDVLGYLPSKATVQVGWPAALITSTNDGRAFVPCLEATNAPVSVANVASDLLNLALPGSGDMIEFLLTSDIILPSKGRRDRITPSHEYGHFFFCDLLNHERANTFNLVWSQVIKDTLPKQKNTEVTQINEGFADWFASQVTGGVSYFSLNGRMSYSGGRKVFQASSQQYGFFAPGSPGNGLGMEENVGAESCDTTAGPVWTGHLPWPRCQHTEGLEDLRLGIATFATLLHDVIDPDYPTRGNGRTGDAAVWRYGGTARPFVLTDGPWSDIGDEEIELPANIMVDGIRDFANRNGPFGTRLSLDELFSPIAQKMMNAGYSREQVCALVKLHRPNFECPKSLVPDAPPVVVIQ